MSHTMEMEISKLISTLNYGTSKPISTCGRHVILHYLGVLIINPWVYHKIVYSASNVNVPQEIPPIIMFNFLWKNKIDKIKRAGLYQDREKDGIHLTDVEIMIKALRLA